MDLVVKSGRSRDKCTLLAFRSGERQGSQPEEAYQLELFREKGGGSPTHTRRIGAAS